MNKIILLLAMWPFHHKPKPSGSDEGMTLFRLCVREDGSKCAPGESGHSFGESPNVVIEKCSKQGKLYFYAGDDGFIGFSPYNCEAAINNWSGPHIDPIRMSRS